MRQPQGHGIAVQGHLDGLTGKRLGFAVQESLGGESGLALGPFGPTRGIPETPGRNRPSGFRIVFQTLEEISAGAEPPGRFLCLRTLLRIRLIQGGPVRPTTGHFRLRCPTPM